MQAVILAAGRGKRMGELTEKTPKPLLSYKGETLIDQKLRILPSSITEIIIVIGYLGEQIKQHCGTSYRNIPITYVVQHELTGTAGSLWLCRELLHEPFLVLMSDDIYSAADITSMCAVPFEEWSILVYASAHKTDGGKCMIDAQNHLTDIVEDPRGEIDCPNVYTGVCILTPEIFNEEKVKLPSGEYGLPQTFVKCVAKRPINVFFATEWIKITEPKDLQ